MSGFPHYERKWQLPGMVSAKKVISYSKKRGGLDYEPPEAVVLIYSIALQKKLSQMWSLELRPFLGGSLGFLSSAKKKIAIMSGFGIGAPAVAAKIEELVAFGVKKIIAVGTGGGLNPNLKVGDILLCEEAVRDEGASYHYLDSNLPAHADPGLVVQLENIGHQQGLNLYRGSSWTIDCVYRETREEVDYFVHQGVSAVDMESSAVFAVAQYLGVSSAVILVISDLLRADKDWEPYYHHSPVKKAMVRACELAVNALMD